MIRERSLLVLAVSGLVAAAVGPGAPSALAGEPEAFTVVTSMETPPPPAQARFELGARGLTLVAPGGSRAGYLMHVPQFSMGLTVAPDRRLGPFLRLQVAGLALPGPAGSFEGGVGLQVRDGRVTFRLHGGAVVHIAAIFFVAHVALAGPYLGFDVLTPVARDVRAGLRRLAEVYGGPFYPGYSDYDHLGPPEVFGISAGLVIEFD